MIDDEFHRPDTSPPETGSVAGTPEAADDVKGPLSSPIKSNPNEPAPQVENAPVDAVLISAEMSQVSDGYSTSEPYPPSDSEAWRATSNAGILPPNRRRRRLRNTALAGTAAIIAIDV